MFRFILSAKSSDWIIFLFKLYILSDALSAFILYLFETAGIAYVFYIRETFVLIPLLLFFFLTAIKLSIKTADLFLIVLLLIGFIWGFYNTGNLLLNLFGVKLFFPFVVGFIVSRYFDTQEFNSKFKSFFKVILIFTLIGLVVNYFVPFPWEGSMINVGGIDVESSRQWEAYGTGLKRLAGFTRGSNLAATILSISSVYIFTQTTHGGTKWLVVLATILGLVLTTMKGLLLAYLVVLTVVSFKFLRKWLKVFPLVLYSLSILLPLFAKQILDYFLTSNKIIYLALYSFLDRMFRVWPDTIELITSKGNVLFGRGVGGVGISQIYFDSANYQPADNAFLYIWGNFGLFGVIVIFLSLIKFIKLDSYFNLTSKAVLTLFFCNGIVTAVPSNGVYCLLIGVIIGNIYFSENRLIKTNDNGIHHNSQ